MTGTTDKPRRDDDDDDDDDDGDRPSPPTLDELTALIWSAGNRFDDLVGRWAPPGYEQDFVLDLGDLVRDLEGRNVPRREIAREVLRQLVDVEPDEPLPEMLPWPASEARLAVTWSNALAAGDAEADAALRTAPERRWYFPVKFVVEWAVALALSVVLGPAVLGWAAIVKVKSGGSVFAATTRVGRGGRRFRAYTLRFRARRGTSGAANDAGQASNTFSGVRRAAGLAKLPQLLNVLRGDMALIGPEPDFPETVDRYAEGFPGYASRHRLRPGLVSFSGLLLDGIDAGDGSGSEAGRLPRTYVARRLPYDLEYVRRVGPAIDLRIALGALFATLHGAFGACFVFVTPKTGGRLGPNRSRTWRRR